MRPPSLWLVAAIALAACETADDARPPMDAGPSADAASADGLPDAVPPAPDAAPTDAAPPDAASPDAALVLPLDYPVDETCWDDLALGEKTVFFDGFPDGSEGIAFGPAGGLYVSTPRSGQVWRLNSDGAAEPFAEVPDALGLAATADGALLVASIGPSNTPGDADGALYRVEADGTASLVAGGIDSPNFVTALADGSALVSDDFGTRVWRVTPGGDVEPAIEDIPSPNGMALDGAGEAVYVASTFSPQGEITRVALDAQGRPDPADRRVLYALGPGMTLDGAAMDQHDQLYVAANIRGRLLRVRTDGAGEPVVVGDGLRTPASLAFGVAPGFDPCSLYVTELLGTRIWRVSVGAPGRPLP